MRALLALVFVIALSTMGCGPKDKAEKAERTTPEEPARTGAREPSKTGTADDPGSRVSERQAGREEEQHAASPDAVHAVPGEAQAGEADTIPTSSARVKDETEVTPKPIEPPQTTDVQPGADPADLEPPSNPDRIIATELVPGRFDAATLERMAETLDKIRGASLPGLAFVDPSEDPVEYARQREVLVGLVDGHMKVAQVLQDGSLSELSGSLVATVVEASALCRAISRFSLKHQTNVLGDKSNPERVNWFPILVQDLYQRRDLCIEIAFASHKTMVELATRGSDELIPIWLERDRGADHSEAIFPAEEGRHVETSRSQATSNT